MPKRPPPPQAPPGVPPVVVPRAVLEAVAVLASYADAQGYGAIIVRAWGAMEIQAPTVPQETGKYRPKSLGRRDAT